jgi:hypothetical protein
MDVEKLKKENPNYHFEKTTVEREHVGTMMMPSQSNLLSD